MGLEGNMTVAMYHGDGAEEVWQVIRFSHIDMTSAGMAQGNRQIYDDSVSLCNSWLPLPSR
jgi:hypothetical protein